MRKTKKLLISALLLSAVACGSFGLVKASSANAATEITLNSFQMEAGASVRTDAPTGIRFTSTISTADKAKLPANATFGTLVVPKSLLEENALDIDTAKAVDIPADVWASDTEFNGVIVGADYTDFAAKDYETELVARSYVTYTDADGDEHTVYAANGQTRSIAYVASAALAEGEEDAYLTGIVDAVLGEGTIAFSEESVSVKEGQTAVTMVSGNKNLVVAYSSDEPNIVSVDEAGVLTGLAAGTATVTAKVGSKTDTIIVTVEAKTLADYLDFTVNVETGRNIRILQLTDTQIIDPGQSRYRDRIGNVMDVTDAQLYDGCFRYIEQAIEKTDPDLILLTGDIVYGEFDDDGHIFEALVAYMDSFNIPWAPVYGNHDNESMKGVSWQNQQFIDAKNCLFKKGSATGNGNYTIGIKQGGELVKVVYMMDSNGCGAAYSYTYTENDEQKTLTYNQNEEVKTSAGFAADQIEWLSATASGVTALKGGDVSSMIAFHIPIAEFADGAYAAGYQSNASFTNGELYEIGKDVTAKAGDSGYKGEQFKGIHDEAGLWEILKANNFDGVFCGHSHKNSVSILYDGIRLTFGLKTGTFDRYVSGRVGGTLIEMQSDGAFTVEHQYYELDLSGVDYNFSSADDGDRIAAHVYNHGNLSITEDSSASDGYALEVERLGHSGGAWLAFQNLNVSDYYKIVVRMRRLQNNIFINANSMGEGGVYLGASTKSTYEEIDLFPALENNGVETLSALYFRNGSGDTQPFYIDSINFYKVADMTKVTSVTLGTNAAKMVRGEVKTFTATVAPENATSTAVVWNSSDETVATVDNTGKVTAIKAGKATITATAKYGSGSASCEVTVVEAYVDTHIGTYSQEYGGYILADFCDIGAYANTLSAASIAPWGSVSAATATIASSVTNSYGTYNGVLAIHQGAGGWHTVGYNFKEALTLANVKYVAFKLVFAAKEAGSTVESGNGQYSNFYVYLDKVNATPYIYTKEGSAATDPSKETAITGSSWQKPGVTQWVYIDVEALLAANTAVTTVAQIVFGCNKSAGFTYYVDDVWYVKKAATSSVSVQSVLPEAENVTLFVGDKKLFS